MGLPEHSEQEPAKWERSWLAHTDGEYYNRVRQIMLSYGMGEGDVEMILANTWEVGWIAGHAHQD
jgi:hypothetical protein